jgi:hypothetical protein
VCNGFDVEDRCGEGDGMREENERCPKRGVSKVRVFAARERWYPGGMCMVLMGI